MSSDAQESSSSETLNKATDLSRTNSALIVLAGYQATKMLIPAPSTSITAYTHGLNILGTSASAPDLGSHVSAPTDMLDPAETRNPSVTSASTASSDINYLSLGLNANSFLTTSSVSVLTYNLASISPETTDSSVMSFVSTTASETYIGPVTPSILSEMSFKDDIRNRLFSSDTIEMAAAKLDISKTEIDKTNNENKPGTGLGYTEASTSTTHIVLTDAALDPVDFEINSTPVITETTITSKPAATNLTTSPIVNIIAIESSANLEKAGISKEVLVTDLTETNSICMVIPIKISLETSTESVTSETVTLDKQLITNMPSATNLVNVSATNIATNLLSSILSKVISKPNIVTTPMSIPASNLSMNCITNLDNHESNNQPPANFTTFNEDAETFSQAETSIEISNLGDYGKATEHLESGASKQVRFSNSTVSANSNLKYY